MRRHVLVSGAVPGPAHQNRAAAAIEMHGKRCRTGTAPDAGRCADMSLPERAGAGLLHTGPVLT